MGPFFISERNLIIRKFIKDQLLLSLSTRFFPQLDLRRDQRLSEIFHMRLYECYVLVRVKRVSDLYIHRAALFGFCEGTLVPYAK